MTNPRQQSQKDKPTRPTGTSGRRGGTDSGERDEARRDEPAMPKRRGNNDDEDSPLGNRNTLR